MMSARVTLTKRGLRTPAGYLSAVGNPDFVSLRYDPHEDTVTVFPFRVLPKDHMSPYDAVAMRPVTGQQQRVPRSTGIPVGCEYEGEADADRAGVAVLRRR